jgi:flagellar hook assembly protein FlgD
VYIYSASGELIRKLPNINGVQSLHWDGFNEQGKELGNGVFFVSARIQGELLSKKIMKLD